MKFCILKVCAESLLYWKFVILKVCYTESLLYWKFVMLKVCYTESLLYWKFVMLKVCYTESLLYWKFVMLKVCYTESLLFWKFVILKVCYIESLLYWKFVILKVCYAESFQQFLCLIYFLQLSTTSTTYTHLIIIIFHLKYKAHTILFYLLPTINVHITYNKSVLIIKIMTLNGQFRSIN